MSETDAADEAIEGVIGAWSTADAVGRIQLTTGEWIRFGGTACAFLPVLGLRVRAGALELDPLLGGRRSRAVALVDPADADRVLDETQPLLGTFATDAANEAFKDEVTRMGLLGVLVRERITSRAHLRAWFARAGAAIRFDDPRSPMVRAGDVEYRVFLCTRELPAGQGFVSFGPTTPASLDTDRELALYSAETGGSRVDRLTELAALCELVARCARGEAAVTAHQSLTHFMSVAEWMVAPPLQQWTAQVRHQDGHILFSGLRSLYLPDLWGPAAVEAQIRDAALALVALGRRPEVGEPLGRCRVAESSIEWVRLTPA